MSKRNKFDIFISHAAADYKLAAAFANVLSRSFKPSPTIYCSSAGSIAPGSNQDASITKGHQESRIVVALITPRSMFRPWVIFESGGAHFHRGKSLFVALACGATPSCIPPPMRAIQASKLTDQHSIESLLSEIAQVLPNTKCRKVTGASALITLASKTSEFWDSVSPALAVERVNNSPFQLINILNEGSFECAKKHVFLAGGTLNWVTNEVNQSRIRRLVFKWLKKDKARQFDILISDLEKKSLIETWKTIFSDDFEIHLRRSTAVFQEWIKLAKKEGIGSRLQAKVTTIVSVTSTFIDPGEPTGYMVLSPVTYKSLGMQRPQFIVGANEKSSLSHYWTGFLEQYRESNCSRPIQEVTL